MQKSIVMDYTRGHVGRVVADYLGEARTLTKLECVLDPNVPGCYAFRATFHYNASIRKPKTTVCFLVKNVRLDRVTLDDLEEVEFTSWPPQAGGAR